MRILCRTAAPTMLLLLLTAGAARSDQLASAAGPREVVTRQELLASDRVNLYDYVRLQRPQWLMTRGVPGAGASEVMVYLDGNRLGGHASLRELTTSETSEIRYLTGIEATTRWGEGHDSGAILVSSIYGFEGRARASGRRKPLGS